MEVTITAHRLSRGGREVASQPEGVRSGNLSKIILSLLGVIATIASIVGVYPVIKDISQTKRELTYGVSSNKLLDSNISSLKLYYNSILVDNLISTNVSIYNSGGESIKNDEIVEPIKITLGDKCRLLSSSITAANPQSALGSFRNSFRTEANTILFQPKLINSNDSLNINILSDGCESTSPKVYSRIDGIRDLKYIQTSIRGSSVISNYDKGLMLFYSFSLAISLTLFTRQFTEIRDANYNIGMIESLYQGDERAKKIEQQKKSISRYKTNKLLFFVTTLASLIYVVYFVYIS